MATISIIGSGNMATAIGGRAAAHGLDVEIIGRDVDRSRALAARIGTGATVGEYGAVPSGEIVVVAVLAGASVDVVTHFGDALTGKILIDISNPFDDDAKGVTTTPGHSVAEQMAAAAPAGTTVVKAFNTIFGGVIAADEALDVFFAADGAATKASVAEFLSALGTRPRDAGGLRMAHALEWAGILLVGLAGNGAGFDAALAVEVH